jgi:undecaprenyl-diphosphatase
LQRAPRVSAILVGGMAASLASVFVFGKISEEVLEKEAMAVDTDGVALARATRSPAGDRVFSVITATGEPWALAITCGAGGLRWLATRRQADAATLALAVGAGGALNQVLKLFFRRDRPPLELRRAHASSYSFPSGHAMMTLATYGTLAYLITRRAALTGHPLGAPNWGLTVVYCALVGWSRVYLEVHYPTDVLGAWAAGTVWVTTCGVARSFMEPEEA